MITKLVGIASLFAASSILVAGTPALGATGLDSSISAAAPQDGQGGGRRCGGGGQRCGGGDRRCGGGGRRCGGGGRRCGGGRVCAIPSCVVRQCATRTCGTAQK